MREILAVNLKKRMAKQPDLDSSAKLEQRSGVGHSTINRIVNAAVSTTLDKVEAIASAFGIPPLELLSDERSASTHKKFDDLTGPEAQLVMYYRQLNEAGEKRLLHLADALVSAQELGGEQESEKFESSEKKRVA